jgi:hypothetical protein
VEEEDEEEEEEEEDEDSEDEPLDGEFDLKEEEEVNDLIQKSISRVSLFPRC